MAGAVGDRVVGRDEELATVEAFLDAAALGPCTLVLEGEPGIGKTTLLREVVDRSRSRGYQLLVCRPVEAEVSLSFAALADLLEPVPAALLDDLPAPQRRALAVALLREEPAGRGPDARAVGTAVARVLSLLAEELPVVVAVDDVQWLDPPSAATLAFAARRIIDAPIGIALARRSELETRASAEAALAIAAEGATRLRLGGVTVASLHHIIRRACDRSVPRPLLLRIAAASQGNPFFAVELARALFERGEQPPTTPLPLSESIRLVVDRRLDALPPEVREALLCVAATAVPTRSIVGAAVGDTAGTALERAEGAEVIEERGGRIRFTHPLLASGIYASASAEGRRRLHRRLAGLVDSLEERARHLALAADGPDEEVAAALESAAREARRRGAPSSAAALMALCCDLTPADSGALPVRSLELAHLEFSAGDAELARRRAEKLTRTLAAGPTRARALQFLAEVLHVNGRAPDAAAACEQALAEAGDDPLLRARIHTTLALVSWDDLRRSAEHAEAACRLLESVDDPDPGLFSQALMAYAGAQEAAGGGVPMDVVERALELERRAPPANVADRVAAFLGAWFKYAGDFDRARYWLEETHRAAIEEGDDASLPFALSHFPQLELWTGDWERAELVAREHLALAEQTGQASQRAQALFNLAQVLAHQGREEEARAAIAEVLLYGEQAGDDWAVQTIVSVAGFLELSLGRPAEAIPLLERHVRVSAEVGALSPKTASANLVEALVATGKLDRAAEVLDDYERRARAFDHAAEIAAAARSRALLLGASGDLAGALAAVDDALSGHARVMVPFEFARTKLVQGTILRRRREKRLAREALEAAVGSFEELGASLWAQRARDELRRVGLRAAPNELTETERRIAELAAAGLTNRQVAEAAFVSPKTVEANLSRVYAKLGIRSRAELGARMAERGQSAQQT